MKELVVVDNFTLWGDLWDGEVTVQSLGIPLHENQGVFFCNGDLEAWGYASDGLIRQHKKIYKPSGIKPKNGEQLIALQLLQNRSIPLTILSGEAGSGKTLLAVAHALSKFNNDSRVKRIMIAKSMTPVGREIGFLKGELADKVKPWLGPFYDNFKVCGQTVAQIDRMIETNIIEITPITFIQGRSIKDTVLIIDEVQNLGMDVIKQIITRAAEGSEIILLGDPTQKFEGKLRVNSLATLIEAGKNSPLVGHVHLNTCFRSAIAGWAVAHL